jgi:hypothetical protein
VVLAVGPDGRVAAAEALRGITVFANARPAPALVGRSAAELAGGMDVPGLAPRVLAAAQSAAAAVRPDGTDNGQQLPNVREGVGSSG